MKNKLILIITVSVFFVLALCPMYVGAAPVDPDAECSLTLCYQKDGQGFPDLKISIHRVAEVFPDGTFELVEPYSDYPVNIHGIKRQEQWTDAALTLYSYILTDHVPPDAEALTDDSGNVAFQGLEAGLYLVRSVKAENISGTYVFGQFMVYLPTPNADGSHSYDVEANPKCVSFVPRTEYRVTKLWQDVGASSDRPDDVTVDIYKDGELFETQVLNEENGWSYLWYVSSDDRGIWTVVERDVKEDYTVSVRQNGSSFSIINTHRSYIDIPDAPQTGDSFSPAPWVIVGGLAGVVLLIIGIYSWRRK
jgi:hypothetical protein